MHEISESKITEENIWNKILLNEAQGIYPFRLLRNMMYQKLGWWERDTVYYQK